MSNEVITNTQWGCKAVRTKQRLSYIIWDVETGHSEIKSY